MGEKGLGWFKGEWIGDTLNAGEISGVSSVSREHANAMYDYLKSLKRNPKMFRVVTFIGNIRFYVYWRKNDIENFREYNSEAKEIK